MGDCFLKDAKSRDPGEKAEFLLILHRRFCSQKGFLAASTVGRANFPRLVVMQLETKNCRHVAYNFLLILRVLLPLEPLFFKKSKN